jgi:hypothetical protein
MELFHDRRPKPATQVRLTKKQQELAQHYGLGTVSERGELTLSPEEHRAAVERADDMMHLSSEWGAERRGDLKSAKNLHEKVLGAVVSARPDPCPYCTGPGCRRCGGTGKRL